MADIDSKAQALSAARNRILQLQEQMTDKVLQMAAEVEKLMEAVSVPEAKAFLKARCNLPAVELSTYVGFAKTLKGSEVVLRKARASFPVMKALVAVDADARNELLERMQIGAMIDTKDVASIRRRLAGAKLTMQETTVAINRKMLASVARKQLKSAVASFEDKMLSFTDMLRIHFRKDVQATALAKKNIRDQSASLLVEFESLFGKVPPSHVKPDRHSAGYWIGRAHPVLAELAAGLLTELGAPEISSLMVFSGKNKAHADGRYRRPLKDLLSPRPRVLELCAGAGGLALGLERAGFAHVALIEKNKNAVATLRANRPDWNVVEADIRKIDFTLYRDRVDLLAGGLPCTPFTTVGEKKGRKDKNDLLMEGVRAVEEINPKAFAFENVEGLLHTRHADYVAELLRKLSRAGYKTELHRINTRDYGIAQDRSRIMIVGFRKDLAGIFRMPPKFPEMARNMGDVLADLMSANGWSGASDWIRTMRERPEFDRSGKPIGVGALSDTIRGYQGRAHIDEASRALRNGVSYAPPARSAPTDEESRKAGFVPGLTNGMRARIQDFPDDWKFIGGFTSVADQIGNAVAPGMAHAVGLALVSALKEVEMDWHAMLCSKVARMVVTPPSLADCEVPLAESRKVNELEHG